MTLGALLDLGVPLEWLQEKLHALPLRGFRIEMEPVWVNGIKAAQVSVVPEDDGGSRNYRDIRALIQEGGIPPAAKATSLKMFEKIAVAESKIHGTTLDEVHFHEVGGLDSIVDIVGTALCMEKLGFDRVTASAIPLGGGFVECSHGTLPVPAPATLAILEDVPVYGAGTEGEMVTPTGAAIVSTLAEAFGNLPAMEIETVGYGAGRRRFASRPNVLRVVTGHCSEKNKAFQNNVNMEEIRVIETTIDDMNPELFGYLMEALFADGALDVYWLPVFMKKNRPGTMVQVVCEPEREAMLVERILAETTTSGVRAYGVGRYALKRDIATVETPYGEVAVKHIVAPDGGSRMVPEYEVCREIAAREKIPLQKVYADVVKACG